MTTSEIDEKFLADFEAALVEHERQGEIIRATGELSKESGASCQQLAPFLANAQQLALLAEVRRLRGLAFPPTEYRRGMEDGGDYCAVCNREVDEEEHTFSEHCIPNLEHTADYVYQHLAEENERFCKERSLLISSFKRWKAGDLDTEEFEGLFYERLVTDG